MKEDDLQDRDRGRKAGITWSSCDGGSRPARG